MTVRLPIAEPMLPDALPPRAEPADLVGELLRVGDVAALTGKSVRALHLYEELGLLAPVERTKGGFRLYGPDAATRVRWISRLQDMGFSLPDIREVLQQWEAAGSAMGAMARIRAIYRQKLDDTERQLERMKSLRDDLRDSVAYLDTCEVCDPLRLISSCSCCDLHGCGAPELVAGLHGHRHPEAPRQT